MGYMVPPPPLPPPPPMPQIKEPKKDDADRLFDNLSCANDEERRVYMAALVAEFRQKSQALKREIDEAQIDITAKMSGMDNPTADDLRRLKESMEKLPVALSNPDVPEVTR